MTALIHLTAQAPSVEVLRSADGALMVSYATLKITGENLEKKWEIKGQLRIAGGQARMMD